MAAKNSVKIYIENGYYHIYNRGVNKQDIFNNQKDYKVFLYFFKRYLTPFSVFTLEERSFKFPPTWRTDIYKKIQLIAYCLMPNHFHLLVKQFVKEGITEFMRSLSNSYVRYFNEKNDRVGPLFQGRFKAVLIETTPHLLHLSRYIHQNPITNRSDLLKLNEFSYSSYNYFLGNKSAEWVKPGEILECFTSSNINKIGLQDYSSYKSFVEDLSFDSIELLKELTIE